MLSGEDDQPTVRNALVKRLSLEPGIRIAEIKMKWQAKADPKVLNVGIMVLIDKALLATSRFDLPEEFTHDHLLNELDECCEQYKAARADYWKGGRQHIGTDVRVQLPGTGVRGRWPSELAKRDLVLQGHTVEVSNG